MESVLVKMVNKASHDFCDQNGSSLLANISLPKASLGERLLQIC